MKDKKGGEQVKQSTRQSGSVDDPKLVKPEGVFEYPEGGKTIFEERVPQKRID